MSQIRINLDLPFEYAIRLSEAIANDVHECENMVRFYDERGKAEHAEFYRALADKSRMVEEALDLQIRRGNIYIEGGENESARA